MKRMLLILAAGLLCLSAAGCGAKEKSAEVSVSQADESSEDIKDEAEIKVEEAIGEAGSCREEDFSGDAFGTYAEDYIQGGTTEKVFIYGDFTATVRDKIPDYIFDGETPKMAVVTLFQDTPFVLGLGDLIDSVEIGGTYVFELQPAEIEAESRELEYPDPAYFLRKYYIGIESIRPAEEGETGLNTVRIFCEPAD